MLNHMVGSADLFAGTARCDIVAFPDWSHSPDWLGTDPPGRSCSAADRAIAAYAAPGVLAGNVTMPWGDMPATMALGMLVADHVTHAWDLSQASGVPIPLDDTVVEAALANVAGCGVARVPRGLLLPARGRRARWREHVRTPRRL